MNPKTEPAYPFPVTKDTDGKPPMGLTQYAYVAALSYAAVASRYDYPPKQVAKEAFDHADAFFAELAKRTTTAP